VATAVGGSRDVLDGAGLGWLVPPDHPQALAAALAEALLDRDVARARGQASRAHALEHYALGSVAERLLTLYRALDARRGGDPAPGAAQPMEGTR
jgi:starch synthase